MKKFVKMLIVFIVINMLFTACGPTQLLSATSTKEVRQQTEPTNTLSQPGSLTTSTDVPVQTVPVLATPVVTLTPTVVNTQPAAISTQDPNQLQGWKVLNHYDVPITIFVTQRNENLNKTSDIVMLDKTGQFNITKMLEGDNKDPDLDPSGHTLLFAHRDVSADEKGAWEIYQVTSDAFPSPATDIVGTTKPLVSYKRVIENIPVMQDVSPSWDIEDTYVFEEQLVDSKDLQVKSFSLKLVDKAYYDSFSSNDFVHGIDGKGYRIPSPGLNSIYYISYLGSNPEVLPGQWMFANTKEGYLQICAMICNEYPSVQSEKFHWWHNFSVTYASDGKAYEFSQDSLVKSLLDLPDKNIIDVIVDRNGGLWTLVLCKNGEVRLNKVDQILGNKVTFIWSQSFLLAENAEQIYIWSPEDISVGQ
jgi:hypothetical protein